MKPADYLKILASNQKRFADIGGGKKRNSNMHFLSQMPKKLRHKD